MKDPIIKKSILIAAAIFLVNIIIRLIYVSNRDIALDEPFTLYYSQMDLRSIFKMLYNENNPPFHFIFLHFWIKLFGMSAFSVRLPSVLFSSLAAVMIFKIGNRFFNQLIGIAAALILSFSTMHIFFSHEARVYPLFCFLAASALFIYLSILQNPSKKSMYVWLFFINLLLIYSHYFGFYIIFVEVISVLFIPSFRTFLKPLFVSLVLLGISYVPMLIIFFHRFGTSTTNGTWVAKPGVSEVYGNLNRFLNNRYNMAVLLVDFLIAFIILIKKHLFRIKIRELFANIYFRITFVWFIIPYLLMFFISFKYPMFIDRYILYTSIPFYISIIAAIYHFYDNIKFASLATALFLSSMLLTMNPNPDNNRRLIELVQKVNQLKTKNTITFIAPDYSYMSFAYHYNIDYFRHAPQTIQLLSNDNIFPVSSVTAVKEKFESVPLEYIKDCIYIQAGSEFVDPHDSILTTISSRYKKHDTFHVFEIYDIHYFHN